MTETVYGSERLEEEDVDVQTGSQAGFITGLPHMKSDQDEDEELEGRTGLNCAFALSVIHAGDKRQYNDSLEHSWTSFEPSHPGVLSTLRRVAKSFEGLYDINRAKTWVEGLALGRYREDIYDGVGTSVGNPW